MTASKSLYNQLVDALEVGLECSIVKHKDKRIVTAESEVITATLTALKAHGEKVDVVELSFALQSMDEIAKGSKGWAGDYGTTITAAKAHLAFFESPNPQDGEFMEGGNE